MGKSVVQQVFKSEQSSPCKQSSTDKHSRQVWGKDPALLEGSHSLFIVVSTYLLGVSKNKRRIWEAVTIVES